MDAFQSLFGIPRDSVRPNCLLLPFLAPGALAAFGIKELIKGAVFSSASTPAITVIKTGIGAGFVGDAVLYLKDTPCTDIFFLGSCGLIHQEKDLKIGDLIIPTAAYGFESFSDILNNRWQEPVAAHPDQGLSSRFLQTTDLRIHTCPCISFASLHEEEKFIAMFRQLDADVIEMECAALFLAARKTGKHALAILFISDILRNTRFYEELSPANKKSLSEGAGQAAKAIDQFTSIELKKAQSG